MSIKRITISVPADTARRIKKAAAGRPLSTWLIEVVERHLDQAELERQWEAFYADVAPSKEAQRRAEAMHRRLTAPARRRGAA
jgi:hypothetical protein